MGLTYSYNPSILATMGNFQYQKLGETLRHTRNARSAGGIKTVANEIGVDYSNLSKVENGHIKPSRNLLDKLIAFYKIPASEASQLYYLAGERKGVIFTMEETKKPQQTIPNAYAGNQVAIPENIPVLYAGAVYMDASPFGVVFNFAQQVGPTNNLVVVSRIGMSTEHAEDLCKKTLELIAKGRGKKETSSDEPKNSVEK